MTSPPDDTTTDTSAIIAALRAERDAALAREVALAEVLDIINSSPGDPGPVFEAILNKAHQLCGAAVGSLMTYDGTYVRARAARGFPEEHEALIRQPFRLHPFSGSSARQSIHGEQPKTFEAGLERLIHGERVFNIADFKTLETQPDSDVNRSTIERTNVRSCLTVPLRKDGVFVGYISAFRLEVRPFSEAEVALLESFAAQAVIAMENARLLGELRKRTGDLQESLEYQTATSDVLKVISRSAFDLQPVLDTVVETAARLCNAEQAVMSRREGEFIRLVANYGFPPEYEAHQRAQGLIPIDHNSESVGLRTIAEGGRIVHVHDVAAVPNYPEFAVRLGRQRTSLGVPLMREGEVIGAILLARQRVEPFTDRQIDLVSTFADQAVIAIENTRLITEQREALEQQIATAEVLQVINASPGDLRSVFDAMLEKALRLCEAAFGNLLIFDGTRFEFVATHYGGAEFPSSPPSIVPEPGTALDRVAKGERVVQILDLVDTDAYRKRLPGRVGLVERLGARTVLWVALHKDNAVVGVFVIYRQVVRPFTDKHIALLESFADQAVIAMENARLLTEQREALEQQTATAEVLQVINASPGNLAPVFDAMLEKAMRLCGAAYGVLRSFDGKVVRILGSHGVPPAYAEFLARNAGTPAQGSGVLRALQTGRPAQTLDAKESVGYKSGAPGGRAIADLGGARTVLHVPLVKDQVSVGLFTFYRREVRGFSDKQIALLENFAAQAVIAMENARLLDEQREALEQQTATAEVLQVINSSPGNLAPVFDAVLERALRLCGSSFGTLLTYDGEHLERVAFLGVPPAFIEYNQRNPLTKNAVLIAQGIATGKPVQAADIMIDARLATSPSVRDALVELGGVHALLQVPLVKDGAVVGFIAVWRREPGVFPDKQIALVEGFAAQAVIAMENARLLTEQREALEQQTATAEVLQVINSSPGNLQPVFEAILDKAHRICGATIGSLFVYDGEFLRAMATHGWPKQFDELMRKPRRPTALLQNLIKGERLFHIPDLRAMGEQIPRETTRFLVDVVGVRTFLALPLRTDRALLGTITAHRLEVRPFSEKEIALLENFAAQAVIAMENARLITEQREALEQQTATADVLQVINANPGNLAPVFDAILEKAHSLCGVALGELELHEGGKFRAVAMRGVSGPLAELLRQPFTPPPNSPLARLLAGEPVVQIADLFELAQQRPDDRRAQAGAQYGLRTVLFVPLRKDDALLGYITAYRQEVRPFSEKEIALLQNFAAQAVIAMENTRLITEISEALEQQTATAEVLQVINVSPGDLMPVFDAILEKAHALCGAATGSLQLYDGEFFRAVATRGLPDEFANILQQPRSGLHDALLRDAPFVQITDIADPVLTGGDKTLAVAHDLAGVRTHLRVPLRKDDALLGLIVAGRREVRPFSQKEILLLQSFAAQAVIAVENARLLNEIRQRQAELRTTFDNMGDGVAMFDTDLRLAAWNRNFQQIIDLPDTILETRPSYADYLRLLAERGEFGTNDIEAELSLRIEDTDKELRLERVRPDGRVIEVRRNAVPGGGFVLIYSDITERKRSEEEIRAARDAAETALRELRTAQANLIQAEKMASLGQLTAGIAHEIKNPLNFVNNFSALSTELIDELRDVLAPEPLGETARTEVDDLTALLKGNLEKVVQHGQRADGIVRSMLDHSRGSSGERRMVDLNALIDEALNLAYHGARAQDQSFNITLERDFGEGIAPIEVNPQDITRVFLNLFANGFYAVTRRALEGGDAGFVPTLKVTTTDAGEAVEIRVRDNGTGIPADIRDKLFQPFFTTKPTGEGTGLGLSITYDIVTQQHGGVIAVDSKVGEYSEFAIRLPRKP